MSSLSKTLLIMLLLSTVAGVYADNDLFESAQITPPELPGADKQREGVILHLADIESGECLRDLHVELRLREEELGIELNTIRYFEDCNISVDLEEGRWHLTLKADNLSTEGKDYFEETTLSLLNASKPPTLVAYMKPVGTVIGEVIDEEGRIVVNAKVKFDCSSGYGILSEQQTDSFGLFKGEWLPQGLCKISALYNHQVGSVDVFVERGGLDEVSIELEKTTTSSLTDYSPLLWFILLAALFVIAGYLLRKKKNNKRPSNEPIEPTEGMLSIMKTLEDRQKKIVQTLLEEGGLLQQVDICYKTGTPKASVSRYVAQLESRKIVESTRIGRLKEVKLTSWFLNQ